uniref:uncharacterized protein LOC108950049 n=1 Tax=Ciona intestinalis TaxID=7719 RepID=UPI00089DBB19|nr:uncharacterized protein LOC108950049 [Ciona intestinalis]|eukprot:XP_018670243.1 uncharacterized protein LOC108950049 [Ciona intestinalis]
MVKSTELAAVIMFAFNLAACASCLFTTGWFVYTKDGIYHQKGLFLSCLDGSCNIDIVSQTVVANVTLGLMSVSCLGMLLGLAWLLVGIVHEKRQIVKIGSAVYILAGIGSFAAVMVYTGQTLISKSSPPPFGYSYALGWVAGIGGIVSGTVGLLASKKTYDVI